jgi:hypothetical protein
MAELQDIASDFRRKLDAADKSILPEPFRDFPRGSCEPAAETLGIYIRETLGIECALTSAGIPNRELGTHAWLEYGNLIIDVTADQFDQFGKPPILVTTDRSWHCLFGESSRQPLGTYDDEWIKRYCGPILALLSAK